MTDEVDEKIEQVLDEVEKTEILGRNTFFSRKVKKKAKKVKKRKDEGKNIRAQVSSFKLFIYAMLHTVYELSRVKIKKLFKLNGRK